MSGRHRWIVRVGPARLRIPIALVAAVTLVGVIGITVRIVSASAADCSGAVAVDVAATLEIAPVLAELGADWMATRPQVDGVCVDLTVRAASSPMVASALVRSRGGAIDVGEGTPTGGRSAGGGQSPPAVWVPDSTAWLTRVQAVDRTAFARDATSVASSPIIVAMPQATAEGLGWPSARVPLTGLPALSSPGGRLTLGVADPRRESASLAVTLSLGESVAPGDIPRPDELADLVHLLRSVTATTGTTQLLQAMGTTVDVGPASEQAVLAYNAAAVGTPAASAPPGPLPSAPASPALVPSATPTTTAVPSATSPTSTTPTAPAPRLVAMQLNPVAPMLDYPFAISATVSREAASAARLFRAAVLDAAGAERLARAGFRTPTGRVGPGFPASSATSPDPYLGVPVKDQTRVQRALRLWSAVSTPLRVLMLCDITSSMGMYVRTSEGRMTRSALLAAAVPTGLELLSAQSRVGLWTFASKHQEVLAVDALSATHRHDIERGLLTVRRQGTNRAQLYQSLLAAYAAMRDGYDPAGHNIIVVFTDAGDGDNTAAAMARFSDSLQRSADPTKPIRVVLVGVGVDSNGDSNGAPNEEPRLRDLADAVGGDFYRLAEPAEMAPIVLTGLLGLSFR